VRSEKKTLMAMESTETTEKQEVKSRNGHGITLNYTEK